jgi:hypothetical protein
MHYDQAWIWLIVMLGMPAAMWFGGKLIEKRRKEGKSSKPSSKKKSDSNADEIIILSS